jgi:hypothetical protein
MFATVPPNVPVIYIHILHQDMLPTVPPNVLVIYAFYRRTTNNKFIYVYSRSYKAGRRNKSVENHFLTDINLRPFRRIVHRSPFTASVRLLHSALHSADVMSRATALKGSILHPTLHSLLNKGFVLDNTAVGIRHADQVAPFIRKSWH